LHESLAATGQHAKADATEHKPTHCTRHARTMREIPLRTIQSWLAVYG
jgi:hypothetical protein